MAIFLSAYAGLRARELPRVQREGRSFIEFSPFGLFEANSANLRPSFGQSKVIRVSMGYNFWNRFTLGIRFQSKRHNQNRVILSFPSVGPGALTSPNSVYKATYSGAWETDAFLRFYPTEKVNIYFVGLVGARWGITDTFQRIDFGPRLAYEDAYTESPLFASVTLGPTWVTGLGVGYRKAFWDHLLIGVEGMLSYYSYPGIRKYYQKYDPSLGASIGQFEVNQILSKGSLIGLNSSRRTHFMLSFSIGVLF